MTEIARTAGKRRTANGAPAHAMVPALSGMMRRTTNAATYATAMAMPPTRRIVGCLGRKLPDGCQPNVHGRRREFLGFEVRAVLLNDRLVRRAVGVPRRTRRRNSSSANP